MSVGKRRKEKIYYHNHSFKQRALRAGYTVLIFLLQFVSLNFSIEILILDKNI